MKKRIPVKSALLILLILLSVFLIAVVAVIDQRVTSKLDGVLWTVPAKIYSRSLEIAEGGKVNIDNLLRELEMLSYEEVRSPTSPGQYYYKKNNIKIFLRGYKRQDAGLYEISLEDDKVGWLKRQDEWPDLLLLDDVRINGIPCAWIDAKHFFGADLKFPKKKTQKQVDRYVNEYGQGAIVYRHGFCQSLELNGAIQLDASPLDLKPLADFHEKNYNNKSS